MDNKLFFIEILKYGTWPMVALAAIYFLKDKLGNIFGGGVKSAKVGSHEIQFFEPNQTARPISEAQQSLQNLTPIDPTGLREEFELRIGQQLDQITCESEKVDILVKNLAQ